MVLDRFIAAGWLEGESRARQASQTRQARGRAIVPRNPRRSFRQGKNGFSGKGIEIFGRRPTEGFDFVVTIGFGLVDAPVVPVSTLAAAGVAHLATGNKDHIGSAEAGFLEEFGDCGIMKGAMVVDVAGRHGKAEWRFFAFDEKKFIAVALDKNGDTFVVAGC